MPNSWDYPGSGGYERGASSAGFSARGPQSYASGDDYGSIGGFPVRRMMNDGRFGGYEVQFQGEWMPYERFQDPAFQQMWVTPYLREERAGSIAGLQDQYKGNPGALRALSGFNRFPSNRRGGGPVGSRSSGGGQYGGIDPALIAQLIGG